MPVFGGVQGFSGYSGKEAQYPVGSSEYPLGIAGQTAHHGDRRGKTLGTTAFQGRTPDSYTLTSGESRCPEKSSSR